MIRSNVVYTTDDKLTATVSRSSTSVSVSRSSTSVFVSASLRKAPAHFGFASHMSASWHECHNSYDVIIYLHRLGVGLRFASALSQKAEMEVSDIAVQGFATHPSVWLSVCLSVRRSIGLSSYLSISVSVCLSVCDRKLSSTIICWLVLMAAYSVWLSCMLPCIGINLSVLRYNAQTLLEHDKVLRGSKLWCYRGDLQVTWNLVQPLLKS